MEYFNWLSPHGLQMFEDSQYVTLLSMETPNKKSSVNPHLIICEIKHIYKTKHVFKPSVMLLCQACMDKVIYPYRQCGQSDIERQSFSQGTGLLLDEWTIEITVFICCYSYEIKF